MPVRVLFTSSASHRPKHGSWPAVSDPVRQNPPFTIITVTIQRFLNGVYFVGIHSVSRGTGQGGSTCSTSPIFKMHLFAGASKVCILFLQSTIINIRLSWNRQAVYLCITCPEARGLCSACSIACHTHHEQVELWASVYQWKSCRRVNFFQISQKKLPLRLPHGGYCTSLFIKPENWTWKYLEQLYSKLPS